MSAFGLSNTNNAIPQEKNKIEESTPWLAASDGNLALLQNSLTQLGLNLSASDSNGFTFVHSASSYNQIPMLKYLLAQKLDVNVKDNDGDTPLHHCDHVQSARVLVEEGGADWKITNEEGKTALEVKEEEWGWGMEEEDDEDEDRVHLGELIQYLKGLN